MSTENIMKLPLKSNITLIGMPGSGKSTCGIILSKILTFGFVDTDLLIQVNRQTSLQNIIDESGHLRLREIEEEEILKLNVERHVIATGGSAVYSERAMKHLQGTSAIIFLDASLEVIRDRIRNFETRGIAKAEGQSFEQLFDERQSLYRKYAEFTIDCNGIDQDEAARIIAAECSR